MKTIAQSWSYSRCILLPWMPSREIPHSFIIIGCVTLILVHEWMTTQQTVFWHPLVKINTMLLTTEMLSTKCQLCLLQIVCVCVCASDCAVQRRGGSGLRVWYGHGSPPSVPDTPGPPVRDAHQPCRGPLCSVPALGAGQRGSRPGEVTTVLLLTSYRNVYLPHGGYGK